MAAAKDEPPTPPPIPQRQRRRRVQSEEDLRLAVPTRVELWNLVLPDEVSVDESSQKNTSSSSDAPIRTGNTSVNDAPRKLWYTAQHEHSILSHVSLEIIVHESADMRSSDTQSSSLQESRTNNPDQDDNALSKESKVDSALPLQRSKESTTTAATCSSSSSANSEIVLFQGLNDNGLSVNPQWFHLQEKLARNSEWINLHRDTYESLEFRFTARQQCFLQTPVHPSLMISLGTCSALPSTEMLPVNTLVVFFSDQTLRILPLHYQLLVQYDSSKWATSSTYGPDSHNAILDPQSTGLRQSSLVQPIAKDKRSSSTYTENSEESDEPSNPRVIESPRFRDDVFRALDNVAQQHDSIRSTTTANQASGSKQGDTLSSMDFMVDSNLPSRNSIMIQDLQRQQEFLRRAIAQEKEAQKEAKARLARVQAELREDFIPRCRAINEQTRSVRDAALAEQRENQKLQLLLEAHRIRLVRGLEACFPVELKKESTETAASTSMVASSFLGTTSVAQSNAASATAPTLRGWSLPSSAGQSNYLFSTTMSDEELSAVLGVFCHVVVLLGKYLGVPLRYRIFSNSSRSAVQDDRGIIYPLFLARPVEREQVEFALLLLERNVQCIARARGLALGSSKSGDGKDMVPPSVLEQVHRIYRSMTHQAAALDNSKV